MKIKTSTNLYMLWNFGSIIGILMAVQISVGFVLSMMYFSFSNNMFTNSFHIYFNVNYGWLIRLIHSNLTSTIFILLIIHMFRSIMFKNLINKTVWISGMSLILMTMMNSFIGYSLIWNQMSYWAMMVITNFISSIPLIGTNLILWIWGNFFINNIMVNRFFSIHFITPLMIIFFTLIHMNKIHSNKSSNPIGLNNKIDQINLNPIFITKDLILFIIMLWMFINMNLILPHLLSNTDSFNMMNYFKTPNHIEPEWYFLLFYSILRTIPNKLSGLMMMLLSMMMWVILPNLINNKFQSNKFMIMNKLIIYKLMTVIFLMSLLGTKIMEYPFSGISQILIYLYFMLFFSFMLFK